MKLKYLGDSKDSFKWDYHDFLTSSLGYSLLNVIPMLTPDDNSNHGKTNPERFPARKPIIDFCRELKRHRNLARIKKLPEATGAKYHMAIHKEQVYLTNLNRKEYFSGVAGTDDSVIFLDPDVGFQPEKSFSAKHVLISDVHAILGQLPETAVISVFQDLIRKQVENNYICIAKRMPGGFTTAIYWRSLMFVVVAKSSSMIEKVVAINRQYAQDYPVRLLLSDVGTPYKSLGYSQPSGDER